MSDEQLEKIKASVGLNVEVEDDEDEIEIEDSENIATEKVIDPETGKVTYKRKFGSGVKRLTSEKKAQCPLCKMYYKRLNTAHLTSIHNMTLEELAKDHPDYVAFFTQPGYAIENSEYALAHKVIETPVVEEIAVVKDEFEIIEEHVSGILDQLSKYLKFNRADANFVETPKRVSKAYMEQLRGMKDTEGQLDAIFKEASSFPSEYPGIVVETNILAYGKCPHHLETITYNVHIAYKPRGKKVGLSKLARCAELLCARLAMQEDVCWDINKAIMKYLNAEGVAVVCDAKHNCMSTRGARQHAVITTTSTLTGCFLYDHNIKEEFFNIIERNKKDF